MGAIYLTFVGASGAPMLGTVERLADSYYYNPASGVNGIFQSGLAYATKRFVLNEGTGENRGRYRVAVSGDNWSDGLYLFQVYESGSPDYTQGGSTFSVKGGYEVNIGAETVVFDVYHADIQLNRDQLVGDDEYTVTWFKNAVRITSGIMSPTIQVIKRTDGTDLVAATTMTQIGSTGSYKYDEATNRQTLGESYVVVASATINGASRSFSWILGRDAT